VHTGHAKNVASQEELYEVESTAPPHQNKSWQSLTKGTFPLASFTINLSEKKAICPMGETSISWKERQDKSANGSLEIRFSKNTCLPCQSRSHCTKIPQNPRFIKIRPQKEFELLQKLRQQTDNSDFKKLYNQ
jgi:Transposase DDE domain